MAILYVKKGRYPLSFFLACLFDRMDWSIIWSVGSFLLSPSELELFVFCYLTDLLEELDDGKRGERAMQI